MSYAKSEFIWVVDRRNGKLYWVEEERNDSVLCKRYDGPPTLIRKENLIKVVGAQRIRKSLEIYGPWWSGPAWQCLKCGRDTGVMLEGPPPKCFNCGQSFWEEY